MMSTRWLNCSCSCGRYSWSKPRSSAGFTFCTSDGLDRDSLLLAVFLSDVRFDDRLELLGDALALEGHGLGSVDVHRRHRNLAGARQADADVGVLGFAGTVDHAAHHVDPHSLHAGIGRFPDWHLVTQLSLDLVS